MTAETAPEADEPPAPLLRAPQDGVPDPIETPGALAAIARALANGTGPVAVDAERASGYRYSQRAYLVQLRRAGAGTILIDPIAVPDLSAVQEAIADAEWILHAAGQDLPCLDEVGLRPKKIFDTELAGRLLGDERVALGTMVEKHLGVRLEKHHSAADWSTRPLPDEWLNYAALDVELLVALREVLAAELQAAGKTRWAAEEFEAVRTAPPPTPREEPWRRTSGIHAVRNRRQLATVRALWTARDRVAADRDIAPGRVLPDAAIIDAAVKSPQSASALSELAIFSGPRQRRYLHTWFGAVASARELADSELPTITALSDGPPPPARWRDRDPAAAERLARFREAVQLLADEHRVLAQNLLPSDLIRKVAWSPPTDTSEDGVRAALAEIGARAWQIEVTAPALAAALTPEP